MRQFAVAFLFTLIVSACATSPLGRQQIKFLPDAQVAEMGVVAYREMKSKTPSVTDPRVRKYVSCVADRITAELGGRGPRSWELTVFKDDQANAFALPGGKIGVYSGLLKVARNQDQLAAVIGHEVAHVIAEHPNERVSTAYATQAGLEVAGAVAGAKGAGRDLMGLLGLGAQYGIILPFSRTQESEADILGLELLARAGFNPQEVVPFWENMQRAGGPAVPEFLSTHPSGGTRIADLQRSLPQALKLYEEARARGKQPRCG